MTLFTQLLSSEKDQQTFIRTIWQQQVLFIESAIQDISGIVDADTLADLAFNCPLPIGHY